MKIVKVSYTTNIEFSVQNQTNIKNVMADLKKLNHEGINYNACLGADGRTFTHTAFFKSNEDQKVLNDLSSFKYFQEQLNSSGLETPPKQELITLVDSSVPVFKNQQ